MAVSRYRLKVKWVFYTGCVVACVMDNSPTASTSRWEAFAEQEKIHIQIGQENSLNKSLSNEINSENKDTAHSSNTNEVDVADLAVLADVVYGKNPLPSGWRPYIDAGSNDTIGLVIQAYINKETGIVIVAAAGADPSDMNDLRADVDFAFGGYHPQFREAVEYFVEVRNRTAKDPNVTNLGVTGHSLGGGIAQVLSNTFHLPGATFDAPAAGAITTHIDYRKHLWELGLKERGIEPNFTNFTEHGSLFSGIVRSGYLGRQVQVNLADESMKVTGLGAFFTHHLLIRLAGTVLLAYDQVGPGGQHGLDKFAQYFSGENKQRDDAPDTNMLVDINAIRIKLLSA